VNFYKVNQKLSANTILSHYRIVEKLGAGGMGEVWLAEDTRLRRKVALKLLPAELTADAERVRRFEQEAQAASALSHPNIITVYDIGECEAGRFIVMELVAGRTLGAVIVEDNSIETLLTLGAQMAKALSAAHAAGITHRDIKPDNIMVRDDGYVKLLDFGIARLLPDHAGDTVAATLTQQTKPGILLGTVAYMSPEQTRGEKVSYPSDVFALGIVLYELATGRHPFKAETLVGYLHAITLQTPAPPRQWQPRLPVALNDLLLRMLAKDASQRPTASEVVQALQALERFEIARVQSETMILSSASQSFVSPAPSIAVLPFMNISADEENEYFCDGLAEELISDLSKIRSLRVISRNSTRRLKGTPKDLKTIASELNVRYVLDGSVRKAGQSLRISVQLIDGVSDANLWADKYNGTLEDIFKMQESVSRSIVEALKITLSEEEKRQMAEHPIADVRAYDLYLRAKAKLAEGVPAAFDHSIELLKQGLEIIGENELLYAALGYTYHSYFRLTSNLNENYLRLANECLQKIFALNPMSAHGFSLQGLLTYSEGNIEQAIRSLKQALAIQPGHTEALFWYSAFNAFIGNHAEAAKSVEILLTLDPLNPLTAQLKGATYNFRGEFSQAISWMERGLAMDPESPLLLWNVANTKALCGQTGEAIAHIDKFAEIPSGVFYMHHGLFLKHALSGQKELALQHYTPDFEQLARHDCHFALNVARCFALIRESDKALDFLELSVRKGMVNYPLLANLDPLLANIRHEARFQALMEETWQRFRHLVGITHEQEGKRAIAHSRKTVRHTVGREMERNDLRAAFNTAKDGRGSLVCVAGEPGIGKTTLVEDFLAELAAENQCTIARGRCSERLAGTEAYLPLLEALETLLRQADTHSLARTMKLGDEVLGGAAQLMRRIAATWYAQVALLSAENFSDAKLLAEVKAASQERMKRELANFLQALTERRPLILFFDDLHWADVSTIDLLSFLAGKFDGLKVLIVVTYRPSDMLLSNHPFLQIKPDLQARGLCRELSLEFLTEAEIAEYLALEFPGHRFPPEFPKLIHAKTEGGPLFMADLVRYLRDRGVIEEEECTRGTCVPMLAQALPDIERELPESVRGMIERKIAQLSEDDRKLLTAASVQGYEFDSAVVAQALKLEPDVVEERLEKLERVFAFVKLVSEAEFPNGTLTLKYRFVHVLYQNALYAGLRATRKATLSRDVALALEACYGVRSASVANELALLWEAARDYARASDSFLQAARNAAQIHAHQEAVQLAEHGLAALGKLPETPERGGRELGLQLTLGFSLQSVLSWAAPKSGAAFNRARQLCERAGNDPRLFAALSGVWPYHALQAEFEPAQRLGEQMLHLAEQAQDPVLLVRVFMCRAFVRYYQGELVSAHQDGERALALDRRTNHAAYLSVSNEDLGITTRRHQSYCLWTLGYVDSALALAQEAVTLAEQTAHPFSLAGAHLATGMILHTRRDWPSSHQEFEQVLALAAEYDLGDMLNYAVAFNALTLAYQEPTVITLERAQQAITSLRGKGVTLALTAYLAILGEVFGLADRCGEGLAVIAEALAQAERTGERVWEAELWRIKGELLLQSVASNSQTSEASAEAESYFCKAIEVSKQQSAKSWELRAGTSLARLWQRQGKIAEARRTLAEIYGWFTEGFDTADLKEAKALLNELQEQSAK